MNGKIFIIGFLLIVNLFAGVKASVDKQNVVEGDNVVFSIVANGKNIKFPNITNIDGNKIEGISNSQSVSIINGNYKKSITKSYVFTPSHSLTIPRYEVIIDGKSELTKPIQIKVVKDTKLNKDFKLEVLTNNTAIVGNGNIVTIKFYQKTNVKIGSISLEMPSGNFTLKQIGKEKQYYKGVYQVAEVKYLFIPKKIGDINFNVKVKLGFVKQGIDAFGFIVNGMKYKTIQKNIKIKVKKIYNGLVGDFSISLKVDKRKVKINQPVNAYLKIEGEGDLSNLGEIKLNIPNATSYDNKAKIKTYIKNNKIYSEYDKNFVIVADSNYSIPPMSLTFYSLKDKKAKTIYSKQIDIEVVGEHRETIINNKNQIQNAKLNQNNKRVEYKNNYFYILLSFLIGTILGYLSTKIKLNNVELPKNLYNRLLPYVDNFEIKKIVTKLYNKEKLTKEEKKFVKEFLNENKRST